MVLCLWDNKPSWSDCVALSLPAPTHTCSNNPSRDPQTHQTTETMPKGLCRADEANAFIATFIQIMNEGKERSQNSLLPPSNDPSVKVRNILMGVRLSNGVLWKVMTTTHSAHIRERKETLLEDFIADGDIKLGRAPAGPAVVTKRQDKEDPVYRGYVTWNGCLMAVPALGRRINMLSPRFCASVRR